MSSVNDYDKLLDAIDALVAFVDGLQSVPIEPSPESPDRPHPDAVQFTDVQTDGFLRLDLAVYDLAKDLGEYRRMKGGSIKCRTGLYRGSPTWSSVSTFKEARSRWKDDMTPFRAYVAKRASGGDVTPEENELPECLVTLQQAAAMVSRSKRTLERLKGKRDFPRPKVPGGGGKPNEYAWSEMRSFLEKEYKRRLPKHFPADPLRPE